MSITDRFHKPHHDGSTLSHGRGVLSGAVRLAGAWRQVASALAGLLVLGIVWELWVRLADLPVYIAPSPAQVLEQFTSDPGFFLRHGLITLGEAMAGFCIGTGAGFGIAVAMAHSRFLERSLLPVALLIKVTPVVAIAPLLVIWLGFGAAPRVLIAALITFFPAMVNGVTGLRSVRPEALDFVRSINASGRFIFFKLRLPSSLPYMFAAFRVSVPLSVIGAVVGEWFSASSGLGGVIIVAHSNLDMPTLFAAVFTLAALGIGLTASVTFAERRLLFWHESASAGP
ncbi:MAG: ABC transporter permease [Chloroflexota bacterium]